MARSPEPERQEAGRAGRPLCRGCWTTCSLCQAVGQGALPLQPPLKRATGSAERLKLDNPLSHGSQWQIVPYCSVRFGAQSQGYALPSSSSKVQACRRHQLSYWPLTLPLRAGEDQGLHRREPVTRFTSKPSRLTTKHYDLCHGLSGTLQKEPGGQPASLRVPSPPSHLGSWEASAGLCCFLTWF